MARLEHWNLFQAVYAAGGRLDLSRADVRLRVAQVRTRMYHDAAQALKENRRGTA